MQSDIYEDKIQIPPIDEEDERNRFDAWRNDEGKQMSPEHLDEMEAKYGCTVEPWDDPAWIQCSYCQRWFKNNVVLYNDHWCIEKDKIRQEIRDSAV